MYNAKHHGLCALQPDSNEGDAVEPNDMYDNDQWLFTFFF